MKQSKQGLTILFYDDEHLQIAYREATELFAHGLDVWRHWFDGSAGMKPKMTKVLSVATIDADVRLVSYKPEWLQWEQILEQTAASLER